MSTKQALLKEQDREREIMQGASIETIINGRAYTWLEPSAADRRLMLGDLIDTQQALSRRDSQGRGVMCCFNFLTEWHPEIRKDSAALDSLMFGGDPAKATAAAKEITGAFVEVGKFVQRPFAKANAQAETLTPTP